jgi:membrane protein implicated in regulation of membrane protease activity
MPAAMMADVPALIWLGTGLVLLVAELLLPGALLMWIGLAALGTGGAMLLGLTGFGLQVACFAVLTAGSVALGLRLRRRLEQRVNTPDSGLVGRTAHALAFQGREGRVRLGDSDWPAQLVAGAAPPAPQAPLRVVGVNGVVLVVQPVEG